MTEQHEPFATWAILELMGHRRLAGFLTEQTIAGAGLLRLDIPAAGDASAVTQFYSPQAVYCITPCDEAIAREMAKQCAYEPVNRWELKALLPPKPAYEPKNKFCCRCADEYAEDNSDICAGCREEIEDNARRNAEDAEAEHDAEAEAGQELPF